MWKMNFLCLHVWMIFKVAHSISATHVLVAGNEEAFRSFARNFVPQKFANQIANLVSQATEGTQENRNEYYDANPNIRAEEQAYENREYDNGQYEEQPEQPEQPAEAEVEVAAEPEQISQKYLPKQLIRQAPKKPKTMQVNLDELVEKVRDRLLSEFSTTQDPTRPNPKLKIKMPNPKKKPLAETEYAEVKGIQPPSEAFKNFQIYTPKRLARTTSESPSMVDISEMKDKFSDKQKSPVIESHDLFEKVKLTKPKGKKDSYEDYVIPNKEDDIFVSEEDVNKKVEHREFSAESKKQDKLKPRFQIQGKRSPIQNKMTTPNPHNQPMGETIEEDTKNMDAEHANANNNQNTFSNTGNRDNLQKVEPYHAAFPNIARVQSKGNNYYNRPTTGNMNTAQVETTTKVEYVDDDYYTIASTIEHEPKAMTEFIGGEDYDEPTERTVPNIVSSSKKKKGPKKIVTNMPTKERYKMSTPNYYAKLPRIAEKYNFNEPIPERDREQENLKPFPNPPANINGKVKL